MNYHDYFDLLSKNRMISDIWKYVLELVEKQIEDNSSKDSYLKLFTIYFSLVDDGNIAMSLDKDTLLKKWNLKIDSTKILFEENGITELGDFDLIKNESLSIINSYLNNINEGNLPSIIGSKKIFIVEDGYLYLHKYNVSRKGIMESIDRLFIDFPSKSNFSYKECVNESFKLSNGQEKAVEEGKTKNLIITGGPGTGKTTSILFLLISLLEINPNQIVYLVAPSGKASSRMKESIIGGLSQIKDDYKESHKTTIDLINNLEESTIHRLLTLDTNNNAFTYNKSHQFAKDSIFVIDEASMIDVCIFDALLNAIPTGARIFIMGDKNQLPSVECGAVFGDLLKKQSIKDCVVELDESIRFKKHTKIFKLAAAINNGTELPVSKEEWQDYDSFEIKELDRENCPIFYYNNQKEGVKQKDIVDYVVNKWGEEFFKDLQTMCSDLDPNDMEGLNKVFDYTEISKILTAENEGNRGVKSINNYAIKHFIDRKKQTSVIGYYAGEIMMINKNNKSLDLYNGDSGVLVTFKDDRTLYFMVKKSSNLVREEGKHDDKIFKLGTFVFYPLRLISRNEIDFAYAITIHKSQGSDYKNILVILPNKKGHPLLNKQIIYTAITRTKGNTYILSSQEMLEAGRDTLLTRDTNIK